MKRVIWKYPIEITDDQSIDMPSYAEILSVQIQNGVPCIWALVDPDGEKETRKFEIFGTGNPIMVDIGVERTFIGSFFSHDNKLVWHLFERIN
jgi:hypothetical protein